MRGWSFEKKPAFEEFCPNCKYLFTIAFTSGRKIDVYKQCGEGGQKIVMKYSDVDSEYMSGIDFRTMCAHTAMDTLNIFPEEK